MRILFDGLPITGSSLAIVIEHTLAGWQQLSEDDDLHIVLGPDAELTLPAGVTVHRANFGRFAGLSRVRQQNLAVPRLARKLGADVVVGVLPTTTIAPLTCPRIVMAYDIRHELRPRQFSRKTLAMRKVSYGLGWRQSDGIACISERTRQDLLHSRPWLADRPVRVTLLGSDHVDMWPRDVHPEPYAIAFGQYGNKNVDLVLEAWRLRADRGQVMPLVIVGLGDGPRHEAQQRITQIGLDGIVTPQPWLSEEQFQARFASADLVVFPSDFEGFGLPAVEAMRLGLPLVITPEQALLEVTAGHAAVMAGWDAAALADAVDDALDRSPADLEAARKHAQPFTWRRTAADIRCLISEVRTTR